MTQASEGSLEALSDKFFIHIRDNKWRGTDRESADLMASFCAEEIKAAEAMGRQNGLEEAADVIRDVISEDFDTTGSLVKAIRAIEGRTRISKGGGE